MLGKLIGNEAFRGQRCCANYITLSGLRITVNRKPLDLDARILGSEDGGVAGTKITGLSRSWQSFCRLRAEKFLAFDISTEQSAQASRCNP